jgi:hypothetical protein
VRAYLCLFLLSSESLHIMTVSMEF